MWLSISGNDWGKTMTAELPEVARKGEVPEMSGILLLLAIVLMLAVPVLLIV